MVPVQCKNGFNLTALFKQMFDFIIYEMIQKTSETR